jgi:hypothetical protein
MRRTVGSITLDDIEAVARTESEKLNHYYVGVEHLFIALTRLEGGITRGVLERVGQSPRYVRYAIREAAGRGEPVRRWPGHPLTPRAAKVLAETRRVIGIGTIQPADRALLLTILEEGQSLPVRALRDAQVDIEALWRIIIEWSEEIPTPVLPARAIQGGEALDPGQQRVLGEMFRRYERVRVEKVFTPGAGNYSGSTVVLVRPEGADRRFDALVVVKLDDKASILWEKQRYDSYVRDRLPARTARIEAEPTLPDRSSLGGLKYTFVGQGNSVAPDNLLAYIAARPAEVVTRFLRESLYGVFGETWWRQRRPYTFPVWQEYDLLLPPALIIDVLPEAPILSSGRVLRPDGSWLQSGGLHPGQVVTLEGFVVHRVMGDQGSIRLAAGPGAEAINYSSRVMVHGLGAEAKRFWRGDPAPRLTGRIRQTRDDLLQEHVQALEPDFDFLQERMPYTSTDGQVQQLPNPLRGYARLLGDRITGTLSTIHGDLHTGNVLIGPHDEAWLIDFEWARDGHTLFDWAVLEISLALDHLAACFEPDWDSMRQAAAHLEALAAPDSADARIAAAVHAVREVRAIAAELLAVEDAWAEYHTGLALCALRAVGWGNRPLAARRLAYLIAALAMRAARGNRAGDQELTTDQTHDQLRGTGLSLEDLRE